MYSVGVQQCDEHGKESCLLYNQLTRICTGLCHPLHWCLSTGVANAFCTKVVKWDQWEGGLLFQNIHIQDFDYSGTSASMVHTKDSVHIYVHIFQVGQSFQVQPFQSL